jgi:hypothetical protein
MQNVSTLLAPTVALVILDLKEMENNAKVVTQRR